MSKEWVMSKVNKLMVLTTLLFVSSLQAEESSFILNNESFELALINSNHSNSAYSTGRGIFIGLSAPMYVTDYGITSLALDGGYGNVGTIDGEDEIGDPYSMRMTVVQLGLRGSAMLTSQLSGFAKVSAARINADSSDTGKDITYESQLAAGFEWHLPKGLGLSVTYSQVTNDVNSVMLGISIR